jgi:hypothetical protein
MELPGTASIINGKTSLVLNDDLDGAQPIRARTTSHTTDNYLRRSAVNLSDFFEVRVLGRISVLYDHTRYG